jgi:uncharacterized protein YeeX (DUF496 family)
MAMLMTSVAQADQVVSYKRKYVNETTVSTTQQKLDGSDLTVEMALEKAAAYSSTLKKLDESKILAKLNLQDVTFALPFETDWATNNSLSVQMNSLLTAISNYDANKQVTKDNLEYNIRQIFYSIKDCEKNIELYNESIELMERSLKIDEVRLQLGQMSRSDYDSAVKDYELTKSNKQTLDMTVSSLYTSLNQIMGTDLNLTYNLVLDDVGYASVGDIDVDKQITYALNNNQSIKTSADEVASKKYSLDRYSALYSNEKREDVLFAYTQATRSYEDAQTNLSVSVKNLCDDITKSEQTYEDTLTKLNYYYSQREIMKKQLELGKITQLAYDQFEYSIDQLEATKDSTARSHDLLVRKLNNPNLIS